MLWKTWYGDWEWMEVEPINVCAVSKTCRIFDYWVSWRAKGCNS